MGCRCRCCCHPSHWNPDYSVTPMPATSAAIADRTCRQKRRNVSMGAAEYAFIARRESCSSAPGWRLLGAAISNTDALHACACLCGSLRIVGRCRDMIRGWRCWGTVSRGGERHDHNRPCTSRKMSSHTRSSQRSIWNKRMSREQTV
jgi:hypothetical protein